MGWRNVPDLKAVVRDETFDRGQIPLFGVVFGEVLIDGLAVPGILQVQFQRYHYNIIDELAVVRESVTLETTV